MVYSQDINKAYIRQEQTSKDIALDPTGMIIPRFQGQRTVAINKAHGIKSYIIVDPFQMFFPNSCFSNLTFRLNFSSTYVILDDFLYHTPQFSKFEKQMTVLCSS